MLCSPSGRQKVNIDADVAHMTLHRYAEVQREYYLLNSWRRFFFPLCQGYTNYTRHLPCIPGCLIIAALSVPNAASVVSVWSNSLRTIWSSFYRKIFSMTKFCYVLNNAMKNYSMSKNSGANIRNENLKFRTVGMKHMTFSSLFIARPWNLASSITGSIVWPHACK